MKFLTNLIASFGILYFICYPIGSIFSRGPLGWLAWLIAALIGFKLIKAIFKE